MAAVQRRDAAVQVDANEVVLRFVGAGAVDFAHGEQVVAVPGAIRPSHEHKVRKALGAIASSNRRRRCLVAIDRRDVDILIGEVDEIHVVVRHAVGAAAVLVDARADVEWRWRQFCAPVGP